MSSSPETGGVAAVVQGPTERTPLLPGHSEDPGPEHAAESTSHPFIGVYASNVVAEDLSSYSIANLYPQALSSKAAARNAFALCVLLYHRKSVLGIRDKSSLRNRDVLTQWRKTAQLPVSVRDLDAFILRVWAGFIEDDGTPEDVEEVLWSAFPVDSFSCVTVRVIDFLADGDAPVELSRHLLVCLSLTDTWKYGRHPLTPSATSTTTALARFLDRCGAPRAMHIADLSAHLVYLGALYHFVSWPPYLEPIQLFDIRRTILIVFSLAKLLRPWTYTTLPPLLVFASFVLNFAYYGVVYNTLTFAMLLFALYLEILLIHFPATPSPLLLLRPDLVLPLSILVRRSLDRLLVCTAYFLPGLIASNLMLERAASPSFHLPFRRGLNHSLGPSPIDTATLMVYFTLFLTLFLFLVCAVVYSTIVHPFLATNKEPGTGALDRSWDRYTDSVGLEARKEYFRAVRRYGTGCYFPTPLNLVQVLIIRVPRLVLVALRRERAVGIIESIEKGLWRVVVGPVAFLVSGLWLWYLHF